MPSFHSPGLGRRFLALTVVCALPAASAWAQVAAEPERAPPPGSARACELAAGHRFDGQRSPGIAGVALEEIDVSVAKPACLQATKAAPKNATLVFNLGRVYAREGNYAEALALYLRSANAGYAAALRNAAMLFEEGKGAEKDPKKAFELTSRSAALGHVPAMVDLGWFYYLGKVVPRNCDLAVRWTEKAMKEGSTGAMIQRGQMHSSGRCEEQNELEARGFYLQAAERGDPRGRKLLDESIARERKLLIELCIDRNTFTGKITSSAEMLCRLNPANPALR